MKPLLSVLLMLVCATSMAETKIFKIENPDGSITYSDREPLPTEEENAEQITLDNSEIITTPSEPYKKLIKENEREQYRKRKEEIKETNALDKRIAAAEERLAAAEEALAQGRERTGVDIIAKQGGGTRPSPAYLQRVERLENDRNEAAKKLAEHKKARAKL